ncbi:MAG: GNAT family N-acetyltransferase [Opitutaceae bacterium]
MPPPIRYLADANVDPVTDRQIRDLLTTCFTKAEDEVFKHRRYFIEPYPHRWIIRDPDPAGPIIAHIGVHDRTMRVGSGTRRFAGIAEVCVHPGHRSRGHVRSMLAVIHPWLAVHGFPFSILFGDPNVYRSSGYRVIDTIRMNRDPADPDSPRKTVTAMIRPLTDEPWPEESVYIPGNPF